MIITGKTARTFQAAVIVRAPNPKLAKIFNNACPEVIFAKRRTAKLTIREMLETNSIKIMNGVITNGEPLGKKWFNIAILLS
jgi:predicted secreted protein